jgi:hypothetical protein
MYIPDPPFVVVFVAEPSVYTLTHDSEGYFSSSMLIVSVFLFNNASLFGFGSDIWNIGLDGDIS